MTRRLRMILTMILAVMLCVVFSIPSLAFEAEEPAQEAGPEEVTVTEPVPEPTVTISAPVEIAVIPDEDWGSVGSEALANLFTPAGTEEAEDSGDAEPEETPAPMDTPEAETAAAPETPGPAGTETLTDAEEMSAEDQPAEETPAAEQPAGETPAEETPAEETPAAEQPAGETPETEPPAADTPEEDTVGEETDETVTENQPASEEPVQEFPEEVIPDGEETEEVSEEPEEGPEEPEEAPEELEATTEPETARVTVKVEISMIDETVMRLLAVVDDPEGREFLYQWQVSEDSGMTYTDIPEATTDELKVELTDENISDMWRVRVQAI